MKQTSVKVLDEKDLEFVEALRSLDVPRNVAMLITFLANVSEANSREIETATRMRQPEVSIAMRALRSNNWVEEGDINAEGKGRPMKVYMLSVTLNMIIQHYEEERNREAARAMEAIQRLRELTTT
ncbi:MAG: ArsR family transcriptional regulator [Methanothrix sp.]|nr:ArsR family transcriptional regulator [Methanothrix sp.]